MKRVYMNQSNDQTKSKRIYAHLGPAAAEAFDQITSAVIKGYKVTNIPSLSLLLQATLIRFAREMNSDQVIALRAEIKAHGCKPPKADLKAIAKALAVAKQQAANQPTS